MNNQSSNWCSSFNDRQMSNIDSRGKRNRINRIGSDDIKTPWANVSRVGDYTDLVKTGWGVTIEQISNIGSSTFITTKVGVLMFGDTGTIG